MRSSPPPRPRSPPRRVDLRGDGSGSALLVLAHRPASRAGSPAGVGLQDRGRRRRLRDLVRALPDPGRDPRPGAADHPRRPGLRGSAGARPAAPLVVERRRNARSDRLFHVRAEARREPREHGASEGPRADRAHCVRRLVPAPPRPGVPAVVGVDRLDPRHRGLIRMKSHTAYMTFETHERRELVRITEDVQAAVDEAGIAEGMVLVSAMHITAGVWVNDDEPGLHADTLEWLDKVAPPSWRVPANEVARELSPDPSDYR